MGISHKLTALALASSLVFTTTSAYAYKVGIAMPYQAEAHWYEQGFNLEKMLKDKDYETIYNQIKALKNEIVKIENNLKQEGNL